MLRFVLQRKFGKGSLIAITLLLVVIAGTVSAVRPSNISAASLDTCGYDPSAAPSPNGGTVVFNENTVTRAIAFYGVGLSGHVGVFANDETGLWVGAGGSPSSATLEAKPAVLGSGSDTGGRNIAPEIFLTDITNGSSTAGDWEHGGTAANAGNPPWATALYGSWTNTLGQKPVVKNNWNLGPNADPIPATDAFGGSTTSFNEGYGTEVQWDVANLEAYDPATGTEVPLQPGHKYRVQSLTHDADQNKGYGDVGEVCTTFSVPAPNLTITKTADAPSVNAGDPIGFTVEIKNTGTVAATNSTLTDPLPAGSGTGVTWAIDSNPGSHFVLSGNAGNQSLGLASTTIPVGADWTVHITATTSAAECSKYDNTATVKADGSNPPPAEAVVTCAKPGLNILKTADAPQVNAGDPVGFTVTVWNTGAGDAKGVALSDPLPGNSGLNWTLDSQGAGWNNSCAITGAVGNQSLNCGTVTVPANTTQAGSTFTVHISSPTTAATAGTCQTGSGVVDNTGTVTSTNGPSDQSEASTCVKKPSILIVKTADAPQVSAGDPVGFTMTVSNGGPGDAKGATLNDPLPGNSGLNWTIDNQGAGWNNSCSITGAVGSQSLSCGPVTVPAGTTQGGSTYTVHVTSGTTAATGGNCPNSGVVDNTGTVTITNGDSSHSEATTCVAKPSILIVKTADAPQVSAGDPIGFTMTVSNGGPGDAKGATLNDPLPGNSGLNWTIDNQGAGWNNSCSITGAIGSQTLTCGPVTVPAGTTQGGSTYTVHVTSATTAATGGNCPNSGVVDNTGTVTITNGGQSQSQATTCVAKPSILIVKTADAPQVSAGDPIGFTMTVSNGGPGDAKGATLNDPLPGNSGLNWTIAGQGSGWGNSCSITGAVGSQSLTCGPVTVPAGTTQGASTYTVHVTSATTAATGGNCPNSGVVDNTGTVTISNGGQSQSEATTCVAKPSILIVKTADQAQVSAGDPIGFTMTVSNGGPGDAKGATLNDPLPGNSGLNWTIQSQGAGWNNSCSITGAIGSQTLTCGPVTVPAGTTQAGSTYTVHVTSGTTAATGGNCPITGVVDNTGTVTISNGGPSQSEATVCVAKPVIQILKTADAPQVNAGEPIGFTITVWNAGTGDAKGVSVSDPLPNNSGLNWQIQSQGAGWGNSCSITGGIGNQSLSCGPVTVPFGTTQAGSSFTVHITSATTAATSGVCPGGSGVVNNTGTVTTTNDGSAQSSASTCVAKPNIQILKTADAPQVNAGDPIGFTMTVWNTGSGDAKGATLNDPLPGNSGLNWTIDNQGSGWGNSCSITGAVGNQSLTCGPVTVPAGTTQGASTYTVHVTSGTTSATSGVCPGGSGVVNNTGTVTTTNDGSGQSTASTCVAKPSIQIVKTADAPQVNAGDPVGFTLTVYNNGSGDAYGVNLNDPLPGNSGLNWSIAGHGSGWGNSCSITGAVGNQTLSCGPATVPAGTTQGASTFTVHITSGTTAATGGTCPGGTGVVDNTGFVTTTNDGSGQSEATTCVAKPVIQILKTADAPQVNAGDPIGFTLTVYNTGAGDAKGVNLSDPLPGASGLNWTIAGHGAGWGNSCSITGAVGSQTLSCGPATVPAGTTVGNSTFIVHVTSPTTLATGGVCPGGSGVVSNTGFVTTTNDGSDQSTATTCVAKPAIQIVKTADQAQVNAGDPIGFTVTVYNTGTGDAKGVNLNDPLPGNTGLNWQITSHGAGWGNSCSITGAVGNQTLTCGPETVPAGTSQGASSFTVHIGSQTTPATGGNCPTTGNVNNTATVTTSNAGSGQASATTCVASAIIHILKTADATQVNAGDQIGFTLTVYNTGTGDAKGVTLSDPLPAKSGINWSIDNQGGGWNSTCSITGAVGNQTLACGGVNGVTVPFATTLAGSSFTVHIISGTTAATGGVCPGGSGVVNNTGNVTSTNAGTDSSNASTCVAGATIQILKTADAAQVMAGSQIGFTLTVSNSGTGDAKGVTLTDPLPANTDLNWSIDAQGGGWNNTCSITGTAGNQNLTCGGVNGVTVPAGTTQGASTYTVHIISPTTLNTGGICPDTGVVTNTGTVNSTNAGSQQSTAQTCVQGETDLAITKQGSPASQTVTKLPGGSITWTMVVTNNGPLADTNVQVGDPMPAGTTFASVSTLPAVGPTCTGGAILSCNLGTMQPGQQVTIFLVTTPTQEGTITNTAQVVGDLQETDYTNNKATASVKVIGKFRPPFCDAVLATPKQLYAGRTAHMHFTITMGHVRVKGVRILITGGAGLKSIHITTKPSDKHGKVAQALKPMKRGILYFKPLVTPPAYPCTAKVGVASIVPPPVTG